MLSPFVARAQVDDSGFFAPKSLEIEYVPVPQAPLPTTTDTALPEYVKYLYIFAIICCGIVALVVLVIAGVRYMSSAGSASQMKDSKDQIYSALLGLAILLCSWLILNTINPQLTFLRAPDEMYILPDIAPGVYFCQKRVDIVGLYNERRQASTQEGTQLKATAQRLNATADEINKNCYISPGAGNIKTEFQGKITHVYLVPAYQQHQYGVLVYGENGFQGESKAIYGDSFGGVSQMDQPSEWPVSEIKISSAKPFVLNFNPDSSWYAELYELVHYNRDDIKGRAGKEKCEPGTGTSDATSECPLPQSEMFAGLGALTGQGNKVGSVKIDGKMFLILKKDSGEFTTGSEIEAISTPGDSNLYDNIVGTWDKRCKEETAEYPEGRIYPCANQAILVCADFY